MDRSNDFLLLYPRVKEIVDPSIWRLALVEGVCLSKAFLPRDSWIDTPDRSCLTPSERRTENEEEKRENHSLRLSFSASAIRHPSLHRDRVIRSSSCIPGFLAHDEKERKRTSSRISSSYSSLSSSRTSASLLLFLHTSCTSIGGLRSSSFLLLSRSAFHLSPLTLGRFFLSLSLCLSTTQQAYLSVSCACLSSLEYSFSQIIFTIVIAHSDSQPPVLSFSLLPSLPVKEGRGQSEKEKEVFVDRQRDRLRRSTGFLLTNLLTIRYWSGLPRKRTPSVEKACRYI